MNDSEYNQIYSISLYSYLGRDKDTFSKVPKKKMTVGRYTLLGWASIVV